MAARHALATTAGECIAFRELTSRRLGDNTTIQRLMRWILAGEAPAQGAAALVGDLGYRLLDVRSFSGTSLLETGLSVSQLAKLTGWNNESIDRWIDQSLLASHATTRRGQPCRVVMAAQLFEVNRDYMAVNDLAKLVRVKARSITKRITIIGVIAGKAVGRGTPMGALVKLADVAAEAVKAACLGTSGVRNRRTERTWKLE